MNADLKRIDTSSVALWEIVSVVVSCLIAEWVVLAFIGPNKFVLAIPIALALALMIFSHRAYGETLSDIGFRTDNFVVNQLPVGTHEARVFALHPSRNSTRYSLQMLGDPIRFEVNADRSWK